jgi:ubiquinone/menaquinone biosynthesis C-methylase UbiE
VVPVGPGHGVAPYADDPRLPAGGVASQGPREVEGVPEAVAWIYLDEIVRVLVNNRLVLVNHDREMRSPNSSHDLLSAHHRSYRTFLFHRGHLHGEGTADDCPHNVHRVASAAVPAPSWFFRFMYDRESAAWGRRRDEAQHRESVERTIDVLAEVVAPPGPVADLGCGPGAHALALAQRGYDVVGVDGSPRMVETACTRAVRDEVGATFEVHDVSETLPFTDASFGGVLAILVLQHLAQPAAFIADIHRCLRPGGALLITAPVRDRRSVTHQSLYWRMRAACYQTIPGVVRFYDAASLTCLVEDQGLSAIDCKLEPGRVSVLARRDGDVP